MKVLSSLMMTGFMFMLAYLSAIEPSNWGLTIVFITLGIFFLGVPLAVLVEWKWPGCEHRQAVHASNSIDSSGRLIEILFCSDCQRLVKRKFPRKV